MEPGMGKTIAQRRAAKALRRKAVVRAKRMAELAVRRKSGDEDDWAPAILPRPFKVSEALIAVAEPVTAEALDDRVRAVIRDSEPRMHALVIDLEGVDFVDSQGAAKLAELYDVVKTDGVRLRLARVKPQVRAVLDADGLVATLGAESIHGNINQAIEAQLTEDATIGAAAGV